MSEKQIDELTKRVNGVVKLLDVVEKSKDRYKDDAQLAQRRLDELTAEVMKLLDELRHARQCFASTKEMCKNPDCKIVRCIAHTKYSEPDFGTE